MSSLASISLFPATQEQTIESRRRSFVSWGGDLTLEQFLARDALMDTYEQAAEGRFITWVLAPRDDPQTLDFYCSCESFRRDGIIWKEGVPHQAIGYGIASVFTPENKRGHGYARHTMHLLHWVLADKFLLPSAFPAEWGKPPARVNYAGDGWFSALWSDIGRDFYQRSGPTLDTEGWIVRGARTTYWDIPSKYLKDELTTSSPWTWLGDADLTVLWEEDARMIASRTQPRESPISFSFLPNSGVAAFQHRRLGQYLQKDGLDVTRWGIISTPTPIESIQQAASSEDAVFATWMFELRTNPKTLLITRLVSSEEHFPHLLETIMQEARRYDLTRVEIYNLPEHLEAAASTLGSVTIERNEHLPAFKWYGPETNDQVAWLHNERFCWC